MRAGQASWCERAGASWCKLVQASWCKRAGASWCELMQASWFSRGGNASWKFGVRSSFRASACTWPRGLGTFSAAPGASPAASSGAGARLGFSSAGRERKARLLSCPARAQGRVSLPSAAGARLGFSLARRGHKAGFLFRRPRAQGWVSLLPGAGTRQGFAFVGRGRKAGFLSCPAWAQGWVSLLHDDDACTRRPTRRRRVHAAACTTTTRAHGGKRAVGRFLGSTWRQAGCRALSRWHATASGLPGAFSAARGGTRARGAGRFLGGPGAGNRLGCKPSALHDGLHDDDACTRRPARRRRRVHAAASGLSGAPSAACGDKRAAGRFLGGTR